MGYTKRPSRRSDNLEHTPSPSEGQASISTRWIVPQAVATDPAGSERRSLRIFGRFEGLGVMRGLGVSALSLLLAGTVFGQAQQTVPSAPAPQAQATPNAPTPQAPPLSDLRDQVAPGKGSGIPDDQAAGQAAAGQTAPNVESGVVQAPQEPAPAPDEFQKTAPIMPKPGESPLPPITTFHVNATVVDVPVTVMNKKHQLVAGLDWWRFRVYEDGIRQRIWFFTTDAYPLSIALVIDDTLPSDVMQKINESLAAVTGSLTPADSVAVITYAGTAPELVTDLDRKSVV